MNSIISDLGFPRLSVGDADGDLLTKKPQILWRAQVWVHSFGWWSWSHSLVLGLFAITLQGARINLHMWCYAAFSKVWHKSFPLHSWVITQIPPWGLWNDFLGVLCYSSAFSVMSLWRRSNMFSGLTSASPSHLICLNCSGKCYSGLWVCPYLPILCSKHWSAFTHVFFSHSVSPLPFPVTEQGKVMQSSIPLSLSGILFNKQTLL